MYEITCRKRDCGSAAQWLLGWFGVMGKAVFVSRGKTLLDTGITGKQTVHLLAQGKENKKCVSRDVASSKSGQALVWRLLAPSQT